MAHTEVNLVLTLLLSVARLTAGASVIRVHSSVHSNGAIENEKIEAATDKKDVVRNLLHEVEAIAKSGAKADPDNIESIRTIVDDDLLPTLMATHLDRQNQVTQNILAIKTCNDVVLATLDNIDNTAEKSVDQLRTSHIACRSSESLIIADKNAKCQLLTDFVQAIEVPATLPDKSDEAAVIDYVQTMARYFCPKEQEGIGKEKDCTDAKAAAAQKSSECFYMQTGFEAGFCQWRQQLLDACSTHTTCYDGAKTAYDEHKAETEGLVTKWKTEFAALKKISCFIQVWLSDSNTSTADAEKLEECEAEQPNTSEMDIDYGTVPTKAECSLAEVEVYPGASGFKEKEYAAYLDQVGNITACVTQTTVASLTQ